ncbi:hypothetical protein NHH03_13595 [Stieleria sp. TO1_6]|uniref:hypothetical protein n=1 Tax=Stieleria tagensis TaxID=2956795 RepID=UPI00209BB6D2|nr:hypothetical protein [Stieleria tagensis]MCO8122776.1 hypothetical protein [Stieleria tagensis]
MTNNRRAPTTRPSERQAARRRSKWAFYGILGSFVFSGALICWAFTMPFRSGSLSGSAPVNKLPAAELTSLGPTAQMNSDEYVAYIRSIDRELHRKYREKNRSKNSVPSETERRKAWDQSMQNRRQVAAKMQQQSAGKPFAKGSVQWQYLKESQQVLDDTPAGF